MTTNCQWCQSKIEAYFCDDLSAEEFGLFQAHLASCPTCHREVQELADIDPMMQKVLQRRLAQAHAAGQWNTRPRVWKVALAGSGIALAAVLGIGVLTLKPVVQPPVAASIEPAKFVAPAPSPVIAPPDEKVIEQATPSLGKPGDGPSVAPPLHPELDVRPVNGPDFAIIDASGESSTLETFKGHVLFFGVVSADQKEATANLQELHQALGSNPNVRILGVANRREDKFEGSTFPLRFNHASKLLGVQNGQFLIVDAAGNAKLKGSLGNAADIAKARTQLGQLGVK